MNNYLLFMLFFMSTVASAQMGPCLLDEMLREREVYYMVDDLPDQFDLGVTGDNNLWLFAGLMSPRSYLYIYASAEKGKYFEHFPESSMVLREPWGKEVYYGTRGDKWYILGEGNLGADSYVPEIYKYQIPLPACAPERDNFSRSANVKYEIDSVQTYYSIVDIKDAAGALYLADGIYDAHRVHRTITDNSNNSTTEIYTYVDMHTGDFLLEATLDEDGSISKVIYKTSNPKPGKDLSLTKNNFLLYPNSGYGPIRMEFKNFDAGPYTFIVKDITGKEIWRNTYSIIGDITLKEDLSFLPRGLYVYAIKDASQNQILTRRLAIIKS